MRLNCSSVASSAGYALNNEALRKVIIKTFGQCGQLAYMESNFSHCMKKIVVGVNAHWALWV